MNTTAREPTYPTSCYDCIYSNTGCPASCFLKVLKNVKRM